MRFYLFFRAVKVFRDTESILVIFFCFLHMSQAIKAEANIIQPFYAVRHRA